MLSTLAQLGDTGTATGGGVPPLAQPVVPVAPSPWLEFLHIYWDGWLFQIKVGPLAWAVLAVGVLLWLWWRWKHGRLFKFSKWRTGSIKLKWPAAIEVEIRPDHETIRIAYQAWVELTSRKAALPFEPEHDVIVEVYNSWYALFGVMRNLAKSVPADALQDSSDAKALVETLLRVLNEGLRPHLTTYQARFRRWYEAEGKEPESAALSPQQIQQKYPDYKALVDDIQRVNTGLREYAAQLKKIADGGKGAG